MFFCMRTTLDLNDELMRQVKHRAADEGLTLRELFEQALRAHLSRRLQSSRSYRLRWRAEGGGLKSGVSPADFEHGATLRDLMDGLE
jgi:Ribbon-helix-helix protein, copG family